MESKNLVCKNCGGTLEMIIVSYSETIEAGEMVDAIIAAGDSSITVFARLCERQAEGWSVLEGIDLCSGTEIELRCRCCDNPKPSRELLLCLNKYADVRTRDYVWFNDENEERREK